MENCSKKKKRSFCGYHQNPFRACPFNCGYANMWKGRIDAVQKKRQVLRDDRLRRKKGLFQRRVNEAIEAATANATEVKKAIPRLRPIQSRVCPVCAKQFQSRYAKFCGDGCRPKPKGRSPIEREIRHCCQCSHPFEIKSSSSQRFCSRSCHAASKAKPKAAVNKHDSQCVSCGSVISWPKTKFCSKRCSKVHERKMDKILGRKRPSGKKKERKVFDPKPCKECGSQFKPRSDANGYCSRKCALKSRRKRSRLRERGRPKPIHLRIKDRLSGRLRELLHRKGLQKQNAINSYTGCSPKEMVAHIQQQFTDGMNWENYGVFGWHLDHIIPCSRFDLSKEEHCRVCFNWRNIRPLWGEKNYMRQNMLSLDEALQLDPELVRMAKDVGVRLW